MKRKQLLRSIPLFLAVTFASQAALANVVDITSTRLSRIDSPLDYKDLDATRSAINSVVKGKREAAIEYFFDGAKGNFDKFEYWPPPIPSQPAP